MSSSPSDPENQQPEEAERGELALFAKTLGDYRDALMAAGFKRGEAQQVVLQYQEIRMMPVPVALEPEQPA